LTSETLEIIKQRDNYQFVVEIHQTAKGEPQVSVKTRSDNTGHGTSRIQANSKGVEEMNIVIKRTQKEAEDIAKAIYDAIEKLDS